MADGGPSEELSEELLEELSEELPEELTPAAAGGGTSGGSREGFVEAPSDRERQLAAEKAALLRAKMRERAAARAAAEADEGFGPEQSNERQEELHGDRAAAAPPSRGLSGAVPLGEASAALSAEQPDRHAAAPPGGVSDELPLEEVKAAPSVEHPGRRVAPPGGAPGVLPLKEAMAALSAEHPELVRRIMEKQEEIEAMARKERELQEGFKLETEQELERIKVSLQSREKDLKKMAKELEDAKGHFEAMRERAVAEVARADRLVAEKDAELRGIQQAITSLKLVKVEYWGSAERVELAGSFNGWHHFMDMHPDLSSHIPRPGGGRGAMLWETELWLYPGVYEVKFIVDDNWQVDPRRELVMSGLGQNNLLLVGAGGGGLQPTGGAQPASGA